MRAFEGRLSVAQSQDQRRSVEASTTPNTANLLVSRAWICCIGNNCKLTMPRRAILLLWREFTGKSKVLTSGRRWKVLVSTWRRVYQILTASASSRGGIRQVSPMTHSKQRACCNPLFAQRARWNCEHVCSAVHGTSGSNRWETGCKAI